MNFYNENDPKAAAWLRELIKAGHIPPGDVDARSIAEINPDELRPYTQCHFFAGIGGWSLALQLAKWPEDKPVWTGSCPCQPFSNAGRGDGILDPRHLWPIWFPLIRECAPPVVFGEQVASKAALPWLDGVFADLEGAGYACGAADLCAAGVGTPHIRQRLYWVGHTKGQRWNTGGNNHDAAKRNALQTGVGSADCGLANSRGRGREMENQHSSSSSPEGRIGKTNFIGVCRDAGSVANANGSGPQRRGPEQLCKCGEQWTPWESSDIIQCLDGKSRRVESGTFPLAHGVSGRVGLLRGYGNAIVPQVAAAFIKAASHHE